MNDKITHKVPLIFKSGLAVTFVLSGLTQTQVARGDDAVFQAGNLLVSRVIYDNNPNTVVAGVTLLPPNCVGSACVTATASGTYPLVWNNALVDGSFGITSKIVLDQMSPSGLLINSLEVPNSSQNGVPPTKDQMVGSFSSKSEVALNLSTDGQFVTFMGYLAPINALDVSNSNTPGVVDPTNPVGEQDFRVVAQVDQKGKFRFTKTNAYSGNNGRAAILNTRTARTFSIRPATPGTAEIRSLTGSSLPRARKSLPPKRRRSSRKTQGLPRPSAASTSRNWGLRQTRSAKTPTSAVSRSSIMLSIPPRVAAATASTRSISSIRRDTIAPASLWHARTGLAFRTRRPACQLRRLFTPPRSCRRRGSCPTTCAFWQINGTTGKNPHPSPLSISGCIKS